MKNNTIPSENIKIKLPYSKIFFKVELTIAFDRILILKYAAIKMIKLIPRLINTALRKPTKITPIERVKINIVTVPGQGIIPAASTTIRSVESVLQALQLQV